MAKTKIIVLKLKKLLQYGIPALLVLILFLLMLLFFSGSKKKNNGADASPLTPTPSAVSYRAGVYNSLITLNDTSMNLEVIVDTDRVKAVHLTYQDEVAAVMYPLFEIAATDIGNQLAAGTDISELTFSDSNRYTQMYITEEIQKVLQKATPDNELSDTLTE